ncbi:MAG: hypothetical protein Q9217_002336 [Psora testacea]
MDPQATLGLENLELEKPMPGSKQAHSRWPVNRAMEKQGVVLQPPKAPVQVNVTHQKSRRSARSTAPPHARKAPPVPSYIALDIPPLGSSTNIQEGQCSKGSPRLPGNPDHGVGLLHELSTPSQPTKVLTYQPGHDFAPGRSHAFPFEGHCWGTSRRSSQHYSSSEEKETETVTGQPTMIRPITQSPLSAIKPVVPNKTAVWPSQTRQKSSPNKKASMSVTAAPGISTSPNGKLHPATQAHVFTTLSRNSGRKDHKASREPQISKDPLIPVAAPSPTSAYISQSRTPPTRLNTPQHLLLVLDLNGTLLSRKKGPKKYTPRPSLQKFLRYCFINHSILIWSSAKPQNVDGICAQLFTLAQRRQLLGEWGRETLELTPNQYKERVQVYKRLSRIWSSPQLLRHPHPQAAKGERWGQHNTILIDDSTEKAASEPYNHVEVPDFGLNMKEKGDVLGQVVGWLEEARGWGDVSAFVGGMGRGFGVGAGWKWHWGKKWPQETGLRQSVGGEDGEVDEDDEDGGVRLPIRTS